ncbi:MAG: HNH endonuclease [Desulfobacteraceae bacterium]|nr:MAG: HNH endonuclease [Desulfobacteraceae bacterium]
MDPLYPFIDEKALKKEREKARQLRSSQWWKRKRSSGRCHYCNGQFSVSDLTMDHIIPISRGGKSERHNVVPCCKTCNTQKRQLLPAEWAAYMERLK